MDNFTTPDLFDDHRNSVQVADSGLRRANGSGLSYVCGIRQLSSSPRKIAGIRVAFFP
jgi:hypothetical protein